MDAKGRPTTLNEIEQIPKDLLTPYDVAAYLHTAPYTISCQARSENGLPWAYPLGKLTKIPKHAFLHYHRYGLTVVEVEG